MSGGETFRESIREDSFRICILGMSGSGKTYWLLNDLWHMIKDQYKVVVLFTRDHNVAQYKKVIGKMHYATSGFIEKLIELRALQMKNIDKKATKLNEDIPVFKNRILVIFDDILDKRLFSDNVFMDLFTNMRHLDMSTILISQLTTGVLNTGIKSNCTHFAIFKIMDSFQRLPALRMIESAITNIYLEEGKLLLPKESREKAILYYQNNVLRKRYGRILLDQDGNLFH